MNWPARLLGIVAHDLRSPAAVISGYARLLAEGRVPESDRLDALRRIERAAERIASIGQGASDLSHWLTPKPNAAAQSVTVEALVEHALAGGHGPARLVAGNGVPPGAMRVRALDRSSLAVALGGIIDTVQREGGSGDVVVVANAAAEGRCDLLVGPSDRVTDSLDTLGPEHADAAPVEQDVSDLTLALAATIIRAHDGEIWTVGGPRGVVGVRLPAGA